jgi:hypothetical protein
VVRRITTYVSLEAQALRKGLLAAAVGLRPGAPKGTGCRFGND